MDIADINAFLGGGYGRQLKEIEQGNVESVVEQGIEERKEGEEISHGGNAAAVRLLLDEAAGGKGAALEALGAASRGRRLTTETAACNTHACHGPSPNFYFCATKTKAL